MLIREATIAHTDAQFRTVFDQFFTDLTPEQQSQVNVDQVQTDVHKVVRQQRDLNLGIQPRTREETIKEATRLISAGAHQTAGDGTAKRDATLSALDCGVAITMVVVDSVMVVLQAVGLPGAIAERSAARLVNQAAPLVNRSLAVFKSLVNNVRLAVTAAEKAKAYYAVFVTFTRTFGVKAIFKEVRQTMHWYDWLLLGIIILLQILLLIATDGAAIILQIIMLIASITALGVAIFNAVNACRLDDHRRRDAPDIVDKGLLLLPGEFLLPNEQLTSANGEFRLLMKNNTNMTVYNKADEVCWFTEISGGLGGVLRMGDEGSLSIRVDQASPFIAWYAKMPSMEGNYLMLTNNGKLVVMNSNDHTMKWSS
ncbi:MAG: hypothetical protein AB8H12_04155 [Lewinella sp.]